MPEATHAGTRVGAAGAGGSGGAPACEVTARETKVGVSTNFDRAARSRKTQFLRGTCLKSAVPVMARQTLPVAACLQLHSGFSPFSYHMGVAAGAGSSEGRRP